MQIANISEAKAQLSALIEKVMAGEEVIIGKAGKPVARIIKYEYSRKTRQPGALKGKIKIADDFDMLPDDIAEAFGLKRAFAHTKAASFICSKKRTAYKAVIIHLPIFGWCLQGTRRTDFVAIIAVAAYIRCNVFISSQRGFGQNSTQPHPGAIGTGDEEPVFPDD